MSCKGASGRTAANFVVRVLLPATAVGAEIGETSAVRVHARGAAAVAAMQCACCRVELDRWVGRGASRPPSRLAPPSTTPRCWRSGASLYTFHPPQLQPARFWTPGGVCGPRRPLLLCMHPSAGRNLGWAHAVFKGWLLYVGACGGLLDGHNQAAAPPTDEALLPHPPSLTRDRAAIRKEQRGLGAR